MSDMVSKFVDKFYRTDVASADTYAAGTYVGTTNRVF